jgi:hypothetical protein
MLLGDNGFRGEGEQHQKPGFFGWINWQGLPCERWRIQKPGFFNIRSRVSLVGSTGKGCRARGGGFRNPAFSTSETRLWLY